MLIKTKEYVKDNKELLEEVEYATTTCKDCVFFQSLEEFGNRLGECGFEDTMVKGTITASYYCADRVRKGKE